MYKYLTLGESCGKNMTVFNYQLNSAFKTKFRKKHLSLTEPSVNIKSISPPLILQPVLDQLENGLHQSSIFQSLRISLKKGGGKKSPS